MKARNQDTDPTGLSALDPAKTRARDAVHFRRIIAARSKLAKAEQELRDAVQSARDAGDSWTAIGAALDTTRQAAFQRFGKASQTQREQHSEGRR
jgi:Tfp pilus assembly protein PilF